jgi:CheY-like chemotaxis protein
VQDPDDTFELQGGAPSTAAAAAAPLVLLQDIEPAMADLIEDWLTQDGHRVQRHAARGQAVALILVDIPFPRLHGAAKMRHLARVWPGVPALVLSSTFLPGVAARGEVARQLCAAAVLAAPVTRDALRRVIAPWLGRQREA